MKKNFALLGTICLSLLAGLTACNNNKQSIGILQFGDFQALNLAREGFIAALEEGGFKDVEIDYQNAHADSATSSTLAKGLVSKHSLNFAIATPCATAMKAAMENTGKSNPLLFTAVTDPVGAGLVENINSPEGFVTGSSDMQPEEALIQQIGLVKKMIPNAKKMGIFYCASESNSIVQANKAKAIAENEGLQVVIKTCTDQFNVKETALALANEVDAIWIPTDDTVSNNIGKVKEAIGSKKVLVIAGEEGMLSATHVSISVDYFELGKRTGEMACKILNGETISSMPVYYASITDCSYVYSGNNLADNGFSATDLPTEYTWSNVD